MQQATQVFSCCVSLIGKGEQQRFENSLKELDAFGNQILVASKELSEATDKQTAMEKLRAIGMQARVALSMLENVVGGNPALKKGSLDVFSALAQFNALFEQQSETGKLLTDAVAKMEQQAKGGTGFRSSNFLQLRE
jgi:hypothetical protein